MFLAHAPLISEISFIDQQRIQSTWRNGPNKLCLNNCIVLQLDFVYGNCKNKSNICYDKKVKVYDFSTNSVTADSHPTELHFKDWSFRLRLPWRLHQCSKIKNLSLSPLTTLSWCLLAQNKPYVYGHNLPWIDLILNLYLWYQFRFLFVCLCLRPGTFLLKPL